MITTKQCLCGFKKLTKAANDLGYKPRWKRAEPPKWQPTENALPNFDASIFKEVSGIDVTENAGKKQALLSKADELIEKANQLKAEAEKL